jgi:ParB-like chromosome segregation protein Spo0J
MGITLDVHPAAAIFPMLSDSELTEMGKSITAFGLREKIAVIASDEPETWLVLDGRNRLEALRRIGVKDDIIFNEFTSQIELSKMNATPEEYVLMANIERRNLGAEQRRKLAGKLAVMLAERQEHLPKAQQIDTLSRAAEITGVSRRTAATAKQEVLEIAKSQSEVEGTKPKKKATPKKKAGAKRPPANIVVVLGEMAEDVNTFGHNFSLDEMNGIVNKTKVLFDYAESKLGSIAEKAAKEAERIAGEAAKVAEATKARRAK